MNSHIQGPVVGQHTGAIVSQRGFKLLFNAGTARKVCQIRASTKAPVLVEFIPIVETAFNAGTTNVATVGYDTTANQYLASGDIDETTVAVGAVKRFLLTANKDIYLKFAQTGTAATTGAATIIVRATGLGRGQSLRSFGEG